MQYKQSQMYKPKKVSLSKYQPSNREIRMYLYAQKQTIIQKTKLYGDVKRRGINNLFWFEYCFVEEA